MPTIMLIALVLASPFPWKRKWLSLIIGCVLVTLFALFKQWIQIQFLCSTEPYLHLYEFTDVQKKILAYLYQYFVIELGPSWFAIVVIWLLVSFRKDDMELIIM